MLNLRCETSTTLQAIDYTKDKTSGKMMRAHASNKATNDDLPSLLHLGINARVILTKNIDTNDGLVNGAFGTVVAIGNPNKDGIVPSICVRFDNSNSGKNRQKDYGSYVPEGVVIERIEEKFSQDERIKTTVSPQTWMGLDGPQNTGTHCTANCL